MLVVRYAHCTVEESQNPKPDTNQVPRLGLTQIDALLEHGELVNYYWRIPPVQICTAGLAGPLRLGPLMRKPWR